jgi:preprotein translocase subunit SecA
MTGTALTEAAEFGEIYNLEVVDIPTNKPVARIDEDDEVYGTLQEKYDAIVAVIKECHARAQPVLVGTVSIEKSEELSTILKKNNINHQVLNARYHEQEAMIIADAGRPGAVTIATNMAGRGTDIQLGGNLEMRLEQKLEGVTLPEERARLTASITADIEAARVKVKEAGGLCVIGTERHESRRIDNQLRGRSGRQGDPGMTLFFLSLEDDLLRIFGAEGMRGLLQNMGLKDGEKISHPMITNMLKKAQTKVEARNFDIRKNLLKFDDIMNAQRKVIYEQRRDIMAADDVNDTIKDLREETIDKMVGAAIPANSYPEQWDLEGLQTTVKDTLALDLPIPAWGQEDGIAEKEIQERINAAAASVMQEKERIEGAATIRRVEKAALLHVLDQSWKEHLLTLDHLRQGIHLRGYAQRDPLNEYSREAFQLFEVMLSEIRLNVTKLLMHAKVTMPSLDDMAAAAKTPRMELHGNLPGDAMGDGTILPEGMIHRLPSRAERAAPVSLAPVHIKFDAGDPASWIHTPRNAPCPCGSGKKYKHCHGGAG